MRRIAVLVFLGLAATASAQTQAAAVNPWTRCTTLEIFGGAANASPNETVRRAANMMRGRCSSLYYRVPHRKQHGERSW